MSNDMTEGWPQTLGKYKKKKNRKSVRYRQSVEMTSFPPRTGYAYIVATRLIGRIIAYSCLWLNVDGGTKRPSGSRKSGMK